MGRWPEEPYFAFLLEIENVLRDDKGLVAEVKALAVSERLQYLGWTRARALLRLAINRGILHHALEVLPSKRHLTSNKLFVRVELDQKTFLD